MICEGGKLLKDLEDDALFGSIFEAAQQYDEDLEIQTAVQKCSVFGEQGSTLVDSDDGDFCQEQHAKAAQPDEDDWLLDQ